MAASGSQRNGYVARKVTGFNASGRQVQPEIFETADQLNSDTE